MIPTKCPQCGREWYWERETDFDGEHEGVIKVRFVCYAADCDYATEWFTFTRN